MADEQKPGGSAEDIIEKLRRQMSQLDEAFGMDSGMPAAHPEPAVEETPTEEAPKISTAELLRSLERSLAVADEELPAEETAEEAETPAAEADDTLKETQDDGREAEAPATSDAPAEEVPSPLPEENRKKRKESAVVLEQIDFLSEFDDAAPEEAETPVEETETTPAEDEDTPVFVKEDAPVVVHKESIEPAPLLTPERVETAPAVTVTETERTPTLDASKAEDAPDAQATFFVPSMPDDPPPTASAAPAATEPRFDPTRYDEVLAAYERQREQVKEASQEPPTPAEPPAPKRPPVLMTDASSADEVTDTEFVETQTETPLPTDAEEAEVEEAPADTEAAEVEEAPADAEVAEVEEAPADTEAPETEEAPAAAEAAEGEESPAAAEVAEIEEAPADTEAAETEEAPADTEAAETEEAPAVAEVAEVEEAPAVAEAAEIEEAPADTEEVAVEEAPPADAPVETPPADISVPSVPPVEEPAFTVDASGQRRPKGMARIGDAPPELRDTDRELRLYDPSGRVRMVSSEYRVGEELEEAKRKRTPRVRSAELAEDEEDFMGDLPDAIRGPLYDHPLGRPDRTKQGEEGKAPPKKEKKRNENRYFHEEMEGAHESDRATDYVRYQLREDVHGARIRLIVIAVLAFMLLLFENITRISLAPSEFVDVKTAGFVDALLILGAGLAAWPRLREGARGFVIGRIVPESILLVELLVAFAYAAVYGILGEETIFFSFVPVLGLAVLYVFRVMQCETRRKSYDKLTAAGEKLVLSPVRDGGATEVAALREDTGAETPLVYRIRKTAFADHFSERTTAVCEDERLNVALLIGAAAVSALCFALTLWFKADVAAAVQAFLFSFFLSAPLAMLGVHAYALSRTDEVAGEESAIIGELTVEEALRVRAVAFEDIEAVPSSEVKLSNLSLSCDDPTTVFKYLTALYGHIGGPLCGRFSGMYVSQSVTAAPLVELVAATKNGVSAAIDGAEVVVGNGQQMLDTGITPAYDAVDEKVLADGKHGVLYVAVNGMICLKLYVEYGILPDFERNALHLHRRGIAAILRTYDPNFTDRTLKKSETLSKLSTRVAGKKVSERGDFYVSSAESGIVTSGSSATLLTLLLLCFRTKSALRFGWVYKLLAAVLGGALSVFLTLFGAYAFIPSVYPALYHLILVLGFLLFARLRIRLPDITKETGDGKKTEGRKGK